MDLQQPNPTFADFARLLAQQDDAISVRDALAMWDSREADAKAIQEAIDSFEAGERGMPADQAMADLRAKLRVRFGAS